jgi:branched-chain amino acid transport system permease protein
MTYFLQQFVNAAQLGSIYALIALGYSMVYGVLSMVNFAHGDVFMVGAFVAFFAATLLKLPFVGTAQLCLGWPSRG